MRLPRFSERAVAGAGIFALTVAVLAMMAWRPELAKDDLFKMLAQAIVVQGLVGLSMAYWFTASKPHADDPPVPVKVENAPDEPVPTTDEAGQ